MHTIIYKNEDIIHHGLAWVSVLILAREMWIQAFVIYILDTSL